MAEPKQDSAPTCEYLNVHEDAVAQVLAALPDDETLYDLSELFRVFGDSTRIKILYVLFESELCVCDIARLLNLTQSAVSHQLRILKASNLVRFRREGKTVFYSLDDDHVRSVLALGMEHVLEKCGPAIFSKYHSMTDEGAYIIMEKTYKIEVDCANCAAIIERNVAKLKCVPRSDRELHGAEDARRLCPRHGRERGQGGDPQDRAQGRAGLPLRGLNRMTRAQKRSLLLIAAAAVLLIGLHFVPVTGWLKLVLYLIPYLLVGGETLVDACKGIYNRQPFDENLLMAVATVGARCSAIIRRPCPSCCFTRSASCLRAMPSAAAGKTSAI